MKKAGASARSRRASSPLSSPIPVTGRSSGPQCNPRSPSAMSSRIGGFSSGSSASLHQISRSGSESGSRIRGGFRGVDPRKLSYSTHHHDSPSLSSSKRNVDDSEHPHNLPHSEDGLGPSDYKRVRALQNFYTVNGCSLTTPQAKHVLRAANGHYDDADVDEIRFHAALAEGDTIHHRLSSADPEVRKSAKRMAERMSHLNSSSSSIGGKPSSTSSTSNSSNGRLKRLSGPVK